MCQSVPKCALTIFVPNHYQNAMTDDVTMNLTKAARYVGIAKRTFYRMIQEKRFPVEPLPDTHPRRWSRAALDDYLNANKAS